MKRCARATYANRKCAIDAKRSMLRQYRVSAERPLSLSVSYCEDCDKYHVIADKSQWPFNERSILILQCIAQGYRDTETSQIVKLTFRTVEFEVGMMMKRFNALSRANLVAIAIALGIINPNEFVPTEDERQHA